MSGTLGIAPVRTAWIDGVLRLVGAVDRRWHAIRREGGLPPRWGVPLAVGLTGLIVSGTVWSAALWVPA